MGAQLWLHQERWRRRMINCLKRLAENVVVTGIMMLVGIRMVAIISMGFCIVGGGMVVIEERFSGTQCDGNRPDEHVRHGY